MKKYDAVVIGAGNAGLFTAAALAKNGVKTLVVEKHNMPGGLATSFVRGRFEFDATLHGHILDNMKDMAWNTLKLETEFPLYPLDVEIITKQNGEVHRDLYDYSKDIGQQLDEKYPGKGMGAIFDELHPIISDVRTGTIRVLNLLGYLRNKKGEEASLLDMGQYALETVAKYPNLLKYGFRHTSNIYDQFKVPDYLRTFLSMYWWYIGARLTDVPAILSFGTTDFDFPYAYVKNTAHSYLAEIEKMIRDNGGDILYNTAVTELCVKGRKLEGVKTSQGDFIQADHVISTLDPRIAVGQLMKGAEKFQKLVMKAEDKLKENFTFFMVYMGLDASPEELGIKVPHVIINEELDPNDLWDDMFDLDAPKTIGFMCPNLIVDEVSPEGTSIVSISIPVMSNVMDNLSQQDYIKFKSDYAEKIIRKVEEYMDIDLVSHIEEMEVASPATVTRYSASQKGALGNYLSTVQFVLVRALSLAMNQYIKGLKFSGQFAGNIGYMNMNFGYRRGMKLAKKIKGGK